ncbi:SMI1/KNR4 family protein [Microterricola gilva]|uniref:SMI1/KNR4 family protein n=1 Tax=Microterricola gilva TaxID=393267 RepID=UPI00102BB4AB|nr:SMI1/KNR4 family protein [Microterricola gilva]
MEHKDVWNLSVSQPLAPILSEHTIEHHRLPDGVGFPPSYVSFVRAFGWGRLFGLWLIYTPVSSGFADGVVGRGRYLTEQLHDDFSEARVEGYDWKIEPDGSWDTAQRLTVFAMSENGDYLAWDTGARDDNDELPIYHTARFNSLTRIGSNLYEAIEWLRERDSAPDFDPTQFRPLVPAAL